MGRTALCAVRLPWEKPNLATSSTAARTARVMRSQRTSRSFMLLRLKLVTLNRTLRTSASIKPAFSRKSWENPKTVPLCG